MENEQAYEPISNENINITARNGFKKPHPLEEYYKRYRESINNPGIFWSDVAQKYLHWFSVPTGISNGSVMQGTLKEGNIHWFSGGKLNAAYNCIDKHLGAKANEVSVTTCTFILYLVMIHSSII